MDCSMPGFSVLYHLPEFAQTRVHWVSDTSQSSHPLSSPSPPALNLSHHEGLFQWVGSSHQVAEEYSGLIPFRIDWFDLLSLQGTFKHLLQNHNSKASVLWCLALFMVQLSHLYMTTRKTVAFTVLIAGKWQQQETVKGNSPKVETWCWWASGESAALIFILVKECEGRNKWPNIMKTVSQAAIGRQRLFFFLHYYYWSRVALQCCVSFCSTMKWTSCKYTSTPSLSPSFNPLGHHRARSWTPCAIQQVPTNYPLLHPLFTAELDIRGEIKWLLGEQCWLGQDKARTQSLNSWCYIPSAAALLLWAYFS